MAINNEYYIHCFNVVIAPRRDRSPDLMRRMGNHSHEFHEFFLCREGDGCQFAEERVFDVRAGDIYLFPQGQAHCACGGKDREQRGIVVNFSDDMVVAHSRVEAPVRRALDVISDMAGGGTNKLPLDGKASGEVFAVVEEMLAEQAVYKPGYQAMCRALLHKMLLVIARVSQVAGRLPAVSSDVRHRDQVLRVMRYIRGNYMEELNVAAAARVAGMSRSNFHAVFKKETGKTFTEAVNERRVEIAGRMLRETNMRVLDICMNCGFQSASRFHNLFRIRTGTTPLKYRKAKAAGK